MVEFIYEWLWIAMWLVTVIILHLERHLIISKLMWCKFRTDQLPPPPLLPIWVSCFSLLDRLLRVEIRIRSSTLKLILSLSGWHQQMGGKNTHAFLHTLHHYYIFFVWQRAPRGRWEPRNINRNLLLTSPPPPTVSVLKQHQQQLWQSICVWAAQAVLFQFDQFSRSS